MSADLSKTGQQASGRMKIGIATRFAVERSRERNFFGTKEGEDWIVSALRLAKTTSIPSVNNLHIRPDYWFVLVDENVSPEIQHSIFDTFENGSFVEVELVLTNGWDDSHSALANNERAMQCELQIRLDYDDMLHESYITEILEVIPTVRTDQCLISPSVGISRELKPQRFARITKELPPFLALFRTQKFRHLSIFSFDHDKWPKSLTLEIQTRPLWMQTISGNNIVNRFGRGWKVHTMRHLYRVNLSSWTGQAIELKTAMRWVELRNLSVYFVELGAAVRGFLRSTFRG